MTYRRTTALTAGALTLALGLAGCGGSDASDGQDAASGGAQTTATDRPAAAQTRARLNGADKPKAGDFPKPKRGQTLQQFANSIGASGPKVAFATSQFTPGHNRVAFGVLTEQNQFVYGPTAVYVATSPGSKDVGGPYLAPADLLVTEPAFRSQQAATEEDPFAAIYEAPAVEFKKPGKHAVLTVSKIQGRLVAAAAGIEVKDKSPVPDIGDPAPRTETDTVVSAGSLEAIDTRRPTARELHETSFKDVVGKKPVAVVFATPQLCESRVCGPVVDIALQLKQEYGDRVEFIHQEVYVDNNAQKGLRPPLRSFGLPTEPWLFTVDAQGRVAAKLEGSFGLRAFERSLQAAVDGSKG